MFDSALDSERVFGQHRAVNRTDVRRRGRRRLVVALTVSLAGAAWAGPAVRALGDPDQRYVTRSTYVVRTGDTLWSIAERRLADGAPAAKVADEVARLASLNRLADPDLILAGQRLRT
jgi:nucleoid-associated protein YgaU